MGKPRTTPQPRKAAEQSICVSFQVWPVTIDGSYRDQPPWSFKYFTDQASADAFVHELRTKTAEQAQALVRVEVLA